MDTCLQGHNIPPNPKDAPPGPPQSQVVWNAAIPVASAIRSTAGCSRLRFATLGGIPGNGGPGPLQLIICNPERLLGRESIQLFGIASQGRVALFANAFYDPAHLFFDSGQNRFAPRFSKFAQPKPRPASATMRITSPTLFKRILYNALGLGRFELGHDLQAVLSSIMVFTATHSPSLRQRPWVFATQATRPIRSSDRICEH